MRYLVLIACGFLLSCNSGEHEHSEDNNASVAKTLSDSLYKEVMHGHDRGMAKMGEIQRCKKMIQQQQDSISKLKTKDLPRLSRLDSLAQDLVYAEELMNKWMQEFDPNKAGNAEEEKVAFYTKEKEKVDTVEARIENSIDRAKRAL